MFVYSIEAHLEIQSVQSAPSHQAYAHSSGAHYSIVSLVISTNSKLLLTDVYETFKH